MGVARTFAVLIWKHLVLACEASSPGGSVEREHNVIVGFNQSINQIGHFRVPKTLTFKIEARSTTFLVKTSCTCMRMKNDFHIKG